MTIAIGDKLPYVNVGIMTADGPGVISTESVFAGKAVALFGVPGAFTRTCSSKHLPGFASNVWQFRVKGIDTVACLSVNDPWVMQAWADSQDVGDKMTMLADGALNFTRAAGLEVDLSDKCYGPRCKRFSLLARDGVITHLHFENGGFGETSAERLLEDL